MLATPAATTVGAMVKSSLLPLQTALDSEQFQEAAHSIVVACEGEMRLFEVYHRGIEEFLRLLEQARPLAERIDAQSPLDHMHAQFSQWRPWYADTLQWLEPNWPELPPEVRERISNPARGNYEDSQRFLNRVRAGGDA